MFEDPVSNLVVKTWLSIHKASGSSSPIEWTYGDICNGPTPLIGQSLHKVLINEGSSSKV
ncbi:hypothetical protein PIROE2DRAFT_7067 [Piromyces sp. E2]|nr:hypothetical protein PIROE2DRAFT_7067 [Piromyces sp. E2]|eukprot:OUM65823.1 hypothetical protein PIROE2DRAFT_7067 [Piromyces sp. E2]